MEKKGEMEGERKEVRGDRTEVVAEEEILWRWGFDGSRMMADGFLWCRKLCPLCLTPEFTTYKFIIL